MYLQCLTSLQLVGVFYGFVGLNTILMAVACAQFQKLKTAILDIRQQNITPQHVQKDKEVHKISKCNLQGNLNACIQHHQEITK